MTKLFSKPFLSILLVEKEPVRSTGRAGTRADRLALMIGCRAIIKGYRPPNYKYARAFVASVIVDGNTRHHENYENDNEHCAND
jgi:hypothetical protein